MRRIINMANSSDASIIDNSTAWLRSVSSYVDENGQTPLHMAASCGSQELCEKLILLGADANAQDLVGFTPMHCAARWGHCETLRILLLHGNERIQTKEGLDLFDVARRHKQQKLMDQVLAAPPRSPQIFSLKWSLRHRLIEIRWKKNPLRCGLRLDSYNLQIQDAQLSTWCDVLSTGGLTGRYVLDLSEKKYDIKVGRSYRFRVRSHNVGGWSEWSEIREIDLKETSVKFTLPERVVEILSDFVISVEITGKKPSEGSWIGLYHVQQDPSDTHTTRRYFVDTILSEQSRSTDKPSFLWRGAKGFPADGTYEFRYFEGDDNSLPIARSDRIVVVTRPDAHKPHIFLGRAHGSIMKESHDDQVFMCRNGRTTRCGAWLLACRSSVLLSMLYTMTDDGTYRLIPPRRNDHVTLELPEVSIEAFQSFVRWIYTDEIPKDAETFVIRDNDDRGVETTLSPTQRLELHVMCLADKFDVLDLFNVLRDRVMDNMSGDFAIAALVRSRVYGAFRVRAAIESFTRGRGRVIVESQTFRSIHDEDTLRCIEDALDDNADNERSVYNFWFYKDSAGATFGPFDTKAMRHWHHDAMFPAHLLVRRCVWNRFFPLSSLGNDPFSSNDFEAPSTRRQGNDASGELRGRGLSSDLAKALQTRFGADIYISSRDGKRYFASRWLLRRRSCGLRRAVQRAERQKKRGIHTSAPTHAVASLMRYVYTGYLAPTASSRTVEIDQETCISMFPLALRFGLPVR